LFGDKDAGKITVRLVGPIREELPAVVAYVDLCGRNWQPGWHEQPLKIYVPKGFELVQTGPRSVAFQLTGEGAKERAAAEKEP
jgi:hypothetical protein